MRKMRRFSVICLTMIWMIGCTQTRQDRQQENEATDLMIIYTCGADAKELAQNFRNVYPDMPVELIDISNYVLDEVGNLRSPKEMYKRYGAADLILISTTGIILETWYEAGYAAPLDEFYQDEIEPNLYYPGAFEVGKIDDSRIALPLSLIIPYMITSEEAEADIKELGEYTGRDLLKILQKQMEEHIDDENWSLWEDLDPIGTLDWLYLMGEMPLAETEIEEEIFELSYRIAFDTYRQALRMPEQSGNIGRKMGIPSTALENEKNSYFAALYGQNGIHVAPQIGVIYAESVYRELSGKKIEVLWIPVADQTASYRAQVSTFGLIGRDSARKQEAYEMLRKMMDMPIERWNMPVKDSIGTLCPVNRSQAKLLLDMVENTGDEWFGMLSEDGDLLYTAKKVSLNDNLKSKVENILNHIDLIYRRDPESVAMQKLINRYIDRDYTNQTDSVQECYRMLTAR